MEMGKCSKICSEIVAKSGLKWEGVDWWWATRFVALAMEEGEMIAKGLADIIPQKRAKSGKKPTLLTVEDDDKKERRKHPKPADELTQEDKQRIMGAITRCVIQITFGS